MALQPSDLVTFLGFAAQGDFGPWTTYTKKTRKIVFFAKHQQDKTLTPARLVQRDRFRAAASAWRSLTPAARNNWNRAAKKLCLPVTGYNAFVYYQLTGDSGAIVTISRQSGIELEL